MLELELSVNIDANTISEYSIFSCKKSINILILEKCQEGYFSILISIERVKSIPPITKNVSTAIG